MFLTLTQIRRKSTTALLRKYCECMERERMRRTMSALVSSGTTRMDILPWPAKMRGSGSQRGIAFLIGSTVRWAIDTSSNLKPFADNSYSLGSTALRPKTYYAGTSFDITGSGALTFEPCNDGTTGTSLNFLAKLNGASAPCAVKAATSDTDGVVGIVVGGSGTSGNAIVAYRGYAACSFDGSTTRRGLCDCEHNQRGRLS